MLTLNYTLQEISNSNTVINILKGVIKLINLPIKVFKHCPDAVSHIRLKRKVNKYYENKQDIETIPSFRN